MSCGEREKAAEMGHTPEPWRFNEAQADIDGQNGEAIAVCYWNDDDGEGALLNGRRIVACVNACAGIDTAYLEQYGLPGFAEKISELVEQRAELAAAREEIERLEENHEAACVIIAEMHAAAVGEVTGPKIGVVEDVAEVRKQLAARDLVIKQMREAL